MARKTTIYARHVSKDLDSGLNSNGSWIASRIVPAPPYASTRQVKFALDRRCLGLICKTPKVYTFTLVARRSSVEQVSAEMQHFFSRL
jgi:hypothetical protein